MVRGRAPLRQRRPLVERPPVRRGVDHAPPAPRGRGAVPRQRQRGPPHRSRRAAGRRRPRERRHRHRPGEGRGDPRIEPVPAPGHDRGGGRCRPLQAPPPPGRAQARPRRDRGGTRQGCGVRGAEAAAPAGAAGERGRARGEAARRGRRAAAPHRRARAGRGRVASGRARRAAHRRVAAPGRAEGEARAGALDERRTAASLERRRHDERLESLLRDRNGAEEELADAAGRRESSTGSLYRLRGAVDRLTMRREAAEAQAAELSARLTRHESADPQAGSRAELAREAAVGDRSGREGTHARESLEDRLGVARDRLAVLERSLAEREGLAPAARALAEEGERLALSLLDVDSGYERAVAAALAWRAGALVAESHKDALALVDRARAGGLGPLGVVVPPAPSPATGSPLPDAEPLGAHVRPRPGGEAVAALLADVWVVEEGRIADATSGHVVTREGHRYEPARGVVFYAGETAEAVLLELEARRRSLAEAIAADERELDAVRTRESDAR